MEYFTSVEQEHIFRARFQKRWEQQQDSIRTSRYRVPGYQELQEEDRIFFVEPDGSIYLGEVHPNTICPCYPMAGGSTYGVDPMFISEVQEFTQRHNRYMIIFRMCKEYSRKAGIYPARMITDTEECVLEETRE